MCAYIKLFTIIIVVCRINCYIHFVDFCGFSFAYVNLNEWMSNMSNALLMIFFHPTAMNLYAAWIWVKSSGTQKAIKGAQCICNKTTQKWQWNKINFHFGYQVLLLMLLMQLLPFSHLKWNHQHWCPWFLQHCWIGKIAFSERDKN